MEENKVLAITRKVPETSSLPDGYYLGTWGGYIVEVIHNEVTYNLKVEEGVRGNGFKVVAIVEDGTATIRELAN